MFIKDILDFICKVDIEIIRLEDYFQDTTYLKSLRTKLEQYGR